MSLTNTDKFEDALALAIKICADQYGSFADFSQSDIKNIIKSGKFTIQLK